MKKIIGIDPGYRNLGLAVLGFDDKWARLVHARCEHIDIGSQTDQEEILRLLVLSLSQPRMARMFTGVSHIIAENQVIGPRQTKWKNVAVSWLVASMVLRYSPHATIEFVAATTKFATFKHRFCYPNKVLPKDKGLKRRRLIKGNAMFLAGALLREHGMSAIFETLPEEKQDHIADAFGLAFVKYHFIK